MDVVNTCGGATRSDYCFVYQIAPEAMDIAKVRSHQADGIEHQLQYPEFLLPKYVMVPLEFGAFRKAGYDNKLKGLKQTDSVPSYNARSGDFWEQYPPRFVLVNREWSTVELYRNIMVEYSKAMLKEPKAQY